MWLWATLTALERDFFLTAWQGSGILRGILDASAVAGNPEGAASLLPPLLSYAVNRSQALIRPLTREAPI